MALNPHCCIYYCRVFPLLLCLTLVWKGSKSQTRGRNTSRATDLFLSATLGPITAKPVSLVLKYSHSSCSTYRTSNSRILQPWVFPLGNFIICKLTIENGNVSSLTLADIQILMFKAHFSFCFLSNFL